MSSSLIFHRDEPCGAKGIAPAQTLGWVFGNFSNQSKSGYFSNLRKG